MKTLKRLIAQNRLIDGTFYGADLERGVFHGADLERGVFHGADLEKGVFHSQSTPPRDEVRPQETQSIEAVASPATDRVIVRPPAGQLRQQQEFPRYGEDSRLPYAA